MKWRLLDSDYGRGAGNLAVDKAILAGVQHGELPPTLRFYRWEAPVLSVGNRRDVSKFIDVERCNSEGIELLVRPTPAGVWLHESETAFSICVPVDDTDDKDSVPNAILEGLVEGLELLGVSASVQPVLPDWSVIEEEAPGTGPRAGFENLALVAGCKAVGTVRAGVLPAQEGAPWAVAFLCGSILLDFDHQRLLSLLQLADDELAKVKGVMQRFATVREFTQQAVGYEQVVENVVAGLKKELDIEYDPAALTAAEKEQARKLEHHYAPSKWTAVQWFDSLDEPDLGAGEE